MFVEWSAILSRPITISVKIRGSIADGIRKYFPDDCAYRIGGDEFVLLCPARQPEELAESLAAFCDTIRELGYEVSVGVSESTDRQTLNETVNHHAA